MIIYCSIYFHFHFLLIGHYSPNQLRSNYLKGYAVIQIDFNPLFYFQACQLILLFYYVDLYHRSALDTLMVIDFPKR
jgi:hypothetical protein